MTTHPAGPTRTVARRVVAGLALAVLSALAGWAPVLPASAHDELLSSDPSEAGVLSALPSRAVLTFTGPVADVHEVTVTGPDGSVTNGAATSSGPEVRQNLWAGPEGTYTMTYDVVSSDGHEITGEVHFEVTDGDTAGTEGQGDPVAASSSDPGPDDVSGVVVPAVVVLLAAACALVLWHRRRVTRGPA